MKLLKIPKGINPKPLRLLESLNIGPKPTRVRESKRDRPEYIAYPNPIQIKKKVVTLAPKKQIDPVSVRIADAMLDYARRHEININVRGFKHGTR